MAVHKATRSNSAVQSERHPDHQFKADIFEVLRHLNRGYGVALAAFDKLEHKARRIFPLESLHNLRMRTEVLRAEANRDLLRSIAGKEEQEAVRFRDVESRRGS